MRRLAFEGAVAALFAGAAAVWLPAGGALRGTWILLPFVIAGLRAVGRAIVAGGGRRPRRSAARLQAALLAALVVVGVAGIGIEEGDALIAAGLLLLLLARLALLLPAARPLLGRELPRRPSAVFFWLPLIVYAAIQPWQETRRAPDGDEPYYLLVAHSIAYDFDLDLDDEYRGESWRRFMERPLKPQRGDPRGDDGEVYSRHNPLLPAVLAVPYRIGGRTAAMAVMALLTAALAWSTLRLARRYFPDRPGEVLLAWAIFAFSPPLILYSHQIWIEVPAALLVVLALDRLHRLRDPQGWTATAILGLVLPLALLPLLKLRLALIALPILVLAAWRSRAGWRRWLWLALVPAAALVALLASNAARFGNPLKIHKLDELGLASYAPAEFLRGAVGMFYDGAFGLFATAPLWLLLLPAAWRLLRSRHPLVTDAAVIGLPYLIVVWPRVEWYGGWAPPFRYAMALLPLLGLALVAALAVRRRPGARATIAALGVLTLALGVLWLVVPGWTYNFADGGSRLSDLAGLRIEADVGRFFPSAVRPRLATFLWPLASLALVPLVLAWPGRRWHRAGPWGLLVLLAGVTALPILATRLPSRLVEVEDTWVGKHRGRLFPNRWSTRRPDYRGGWSLPSRSSLTVPIVAGGEHVTVRLVGRSFGGHGPQAVRLSSGEGTEPKTTVTVPEMDWTEVEIGPLPWPAGAPLHLAGPDGPRGVWLGVSIDRLELEWE